MTRGTPQKMLPWKFYFDGFLRTHQFWLPLWGTSNSRIKKNVNSPFKSAKGVFNRCNPNISWKQKVLLAVLSYTLYHRVNIFPWARWININISTLLLLHKTSKSRYSIWYYIFVSGLAVRVFQVLFFFLWTTTHSEYCTKLNGLAAFQGPEPYGHTVTYCQMVLQPIKVIS